MADDQRAVTILERAKTVEDEQLIRRLAQDITEPSDDPGDRASDERCPACGGERAILGVLGTWRWLRCRACGIDSTSGARPESASVFRRRVAQAR